jgi:hypothetical protein
MQWVFCEATTRFWTCVTIRASPVWSRHKHGDSTAPCQGVNVPSVWKPSVDVEWVSDWRYTLKLINLLCIGCNFFHKTTYKYVRQADTAWRHQRLLKHQFSLLLAVQFRTQHCTPLRTLRNAKCLLHRKYSGKCGLHRNCQHEVTKFVLRAAKSNISQRVFPFVVRQVSNYERVPVAVTSWSWFKRTWRLLNRCDWGFFYDCPLVKVSLQLFLLIPFTLTGRVITKQLHTYN